MQTGMTSIERVASQRNLLHGSPRSFTEQSHGNGQRSSEHSVTHFTRTESGPGTPASRRNIVARSLTRMLPSRRDSGHTETGLECMPPAHERLLEGDLDKFLGDHWKRRHAVLTKEGLFFGRAEDTSSEAPVLDKVILRNVARIDNRNFEVSKHVQSKSHLDPDSLDLFVGIQAMAGGLERSGNDLLGKDKSSAPGGDDRGNVIALTTLETSDHCSRKYLLRCDSPERREEWKRALESNVERETKRAVQGDLLRHYQELSRAVFTNVWLRWFFALCILSSFIIDPPGMWTSAPI